MSPLLAASADDGHCGCAPMTRAPGVIWRHRRLGARRPLTLQRVASGTGSVLLLFAAACASSQPMPAADRVTVAAGFEGDRVDLTLDRNVHSMEFDAPVDKVFRALLAVHEELQIPLQAADSRSGAASFMVQTSRMRIADRRVSEFVDCGTGPAGPRADSYRITLRVNALVEPLPENRSRVRALVTASAREAGQSGQELSCETTGMLERSITTRLWRHVLN